MDIPDQVFDLFDEGVTAMLESQLAPTCILVFPALRSECPNCIVNSMNGASAGIYKVGGPVSFTDGQVCPWCQGKGFIETEATETIKLLIDWEPKEYKDILNRQRQADAVNNAKLIYPGGLIKVQGYISKIQQFRQAVEYRVSEGTANYGYWRYVRESEPIPYGLHHNVFFSALLKRIE